MRVPFAAIVVVSVALSPRVGEANPITPESMPPSASDASADARAAAGYSSLSDGGDLILLLSSFNVFDPPGEHGKLRGGPPGGGLVFTPIGGPSSGGSWPGFGGGSPWGGGAGGGQSSGLPGPGSFILLSSTTQNQGSGSDSGPTLPLELVLNLDFGSGPTFSFESCCEDETPTVPEPATLFLLGGGVLLAVRRLAARS